MEIRQAAPTGGAVELRALYAALRSLFGRETELDKREHEARVSLLRARARHDEARIDNASRKLESLERQRQFLGAELEANNQRRGELLRARA